MFCVNIIRNLIKYNTTRRRSNVSNIALGTGNSKLLNKIVNYVIKSRSESFCAKPRD
jgi:hypothetical protein